MHGVGRAGGAITVVNALPTGIGAAVGISMFAEAEVDVRPRSPIHPHPLEVSRTARTPLVEATVQHALRTFGAPGEWSVDLRLRSEIPPARGLKSSSAVASAIALAIARAFGAEPAPLETAQLSAEVSRSAGVSATGAFDDALAGLSSGFVLTDNTRDTVLKTGRTDPEWVVALLVPPARHAPSPEWKTRFEARADEGNAAVDAARRGDWWVAMDLNSRLVEETMRYSYLRLREQLRRDGALGAGVSGLGPALAAVGTRAVAERMQATLSQHPGERTTIGLLPPGGPLDRRGR